jgi:hypothetical protein
MKFALTKISRHFRRPTTVSRSWVVIFALSLLFVHAGFTMLVRGYVVPHLTAQTHWKYGLQVDTDSHVFHEEAVRLASVLRGADGSAAGNTASGGSPHAWLIAYVYYLTGADTPYVMYALDGLVYTLNGLLLILLLHRSFGVPIWRAVITSTLLSLSPLYLFTHSELLREPFTILGALVYFVALFEFHQHGVAGWRTLSRLGIAAVACASGFIIVSSLRSYLTVPLLFPIVGSLGLLTLRAVRAPEREQMIEFAGLTTLTVSLVYLYVVPRVGQIPHYGEVSVKQHTSREITANPAPVSDAWKDRFLEAKDATRVARAAYLVPSWCAIEWRRSAWLPSRLDAKFEALSCARQNYLRFCDETLLGRHADRYCDEGEFTNALSVIQHVPKALTLGLLAPFPFMWLDDFGSGGTGLRRAGYLIDGIADYVLLVGLLGLLYQARTRPDLLVTAVSLISIVTVCALAIPSQFNLARIRLPVYVPLLALGMAGWLTLFERYHEKLTSKFLPSVAQTHAQRVS